MKFFGKLAQLFRSQARAASLRRTKLQVENLESRLVPYSISGNAWTHPELVTLSFVPDGADVGGVTSDLQTTFDNHANTSFRSGWRNQVLKAAQVWAQQTNLNFALVNDNGTAIGSGDYQQGDANFGDIRIGGFNFGTDSLAQAYLPPQVNNYSVAGDFQINTAQIFNLGSTYDLFTVAAHEFGHALGVEHGALGSVMQSTYPGTKTALALDDTKGIRNVYSANLSRSPDAYDAVLSNGSFAAASVIGTPPINDVNLTALLTGLDITTTADLDYYTFTAPAGSSGTMTVTVQSSGLSLLAPLVRVYDANQVLIGSASGLNQYGTTLTVPLSGVSAGQQFYVMVDGADNTAFGTGKYALTLNFGTGASPTVPLPSTLTANGTPLSGGGAEAIKTVYESRINQTAAGTQDTDSAQAVAMDANHNYVVSWSSNGQDGSGYGIYARRFNEDGTPKGNEFRVNTTTAGDQRYAAVAMDAAGNFVVTWSGYTAGSWDVYAQRYNAAGVAQGGEFRVHTGSDDDQRDSRVAMDSAGNFVVTWSNDAAGAWDVYARRYNAAGVALGGEFRANTTTAGDQRAPAIGMNAAGNLVIAWSSFQEDGSNWGVYARQYNIAGVALGNPFLVNTTTVSAQKEASVAMDASGNFAISWSSRHQDNSGWGVFFKRYNALGLALTGEVLVNMTTADDQVQSAVAMDADGSFIITWSSQNQDGSGWGVYARQYDADGAAAGDEALINTTTSGNQRRSSVAMKKDAQGHRKAVIVWSGNGIGDTSGVFGLSFEC